MKSFADYLKEEQKDSHVVMAMGRMNPPTTGHLKMIKAVHDVAKQHNADHVVVASHSNDPKKNPLPVDKKVAHLKKYSPETNFVAGSKEKPSPLHHASDLYDKGHKHLHVVVGSDRVEATKKLLNQYNGVKAAHGHYNFKSITVHSAGERDPDAEGDTGMSGTKMREHAKNNDFTSFRKGIPDHIPDAHAKKIMKDVQDGMSSKKD